MIALRRIVILLALLAEGNFALATTPAEVFARLPEMTDVRISPDGKFLAFLSRFEGKQILTVTALDTGRARGILSATENRFDISWCNWANDTRLLCGYRGTDNNGVGYYTVTRLVAIDADGKNMKVLIQNSGAGGSQFQDSVLAFTPDEPETVLVEADDDRDTYPDVFELNVYTGSMRIRARQHEPIYDFLADSQGAVRLGCGLRGTKQSCYARDSAKAAWRQLLKFETFDADDRVLIPIAFSADPGKAYARGQSEGRDALWEIDLTDAAAPKLIFAHPSVDVGGAILRDDGTLRGVFYETDRPFIYYTDPLSDAVVRAVRKALPDTFVTIIDETRDRKLTLLQSSSDIEPGRYFLLKVDSMRLQPLGSENPALDPARLGRMQSISYPARDGTVVPGYLTVPPGVKAENLPLIVMPHGGPIARDSWGLAATPHCWARHATAICSVAARASRVSAIWAPCFGRSECLLPTPLPSDRSAQTTTGSARPRPHTTPRT